MTPGVSIRAATQGDAAACAAIKNAWIDATPWMPRVHPADDVERHYRETVLPNRTVLIAEDGGVCGFLALDEAEREVTSLFVGEAVRGFGVGRSLLDEAKAICSDLVLWTFVANEGARRFYAREGFVEVEQTEGDNEEGLADLRLKWTA